MGIAIKGYCIAQVLFPKPATLAQSVSPAKQKALGGIRRGEDEEKFDPRFFQCGVYGSHLKDV